MYLHVPFIIKETLTAILMKSFKKPKTIIKLQRFVIEQIQ